VQIIYDVLLDLGYRRVHWMYLSWLS